MADLDEVLSTTGVPNTVCFGMLTDDELIGRWLDSLRVKGQRPNTVDRRQTALNSLIRHLAMPLDRAGHDEIEAWLLSLESLSTRHAYHSDAVLFFRWAVRRGLLQVNPLEDIGAPRVPRSLPRPLSHTEISALLELDWDWQRAVMLRLALFGGLRVSETAKLRWEDIRIRDAVLTVRDGKGGKDRVVPLHPELVALFTPHKSSGPVLLGPRRGPLDGRAVSWYLATMMAALGIAATPHQLRHSFGTEAARVSNGNLLVVARLMGHSSPGTTMGYVAISANEAAHVVNAMWRPSTTVGPPRRQNRPIRPAGRCHR